jgi:hypothetical protein
MIMISNDQMRKIYASARENGIDNVLLHDMLRQMFQKDSVKELTKFEAMDLIDKIVGKKNIRKPTKGRASAEQVEKIRALERELGWNNNPKRLNAFIRKYARTEQLHWLTDVQASNIIEALKKLVDKGYKGVDKFST